MNPWDILAWVGAISASVIVAALAIAIVVSAVRSAFRRPKAGAKSTTVMGGDR
ncbi:hypothetical protein [Microbacterium sp. USHLN272]|uniref:hypothetical protein n=1 Tax=Microbacterium sp. USHLN272 TaxID=3081287 RepID=UPI00301AE132